jgi:hypothetical protein
MPAPDVWYYADEAGQIGPLSLQELKVRLATLPDAEGTLIWGSHLPDWRRAKDVPELTIEDGSRSEVVSSARGRLATEPDRREDPPLRADGIDSYPTPPVLPFVGRDDRSASGKKPKGRWYTKIATREDALKTVKDASNAFFAVAAIQAALSLLGLGLPPGTEAFFIGVAALYAVLAAWLRYGKTRGAAIGLVALAAATWRLRC